MTLTESLSITNHIARTKGGALGSQTPAEAALIDQWTLLAVTAAEGPALEILNVQGAGGDKAPEGRGAIAINAEKLCRPLKRLEAHLSAHSHLVGGRFTVADPNLAECLRYAQGRPTLPGEYPAVKTWLERCQSRPAFQKIWAARMAEPAQDDPEEAGVSHPRAPVGYLGKRKSKADVWLFVLWDVDRSRKRLLAFLLAPGNQHPAAGLARLRGVFPFAVIGVPASTA